MTMFNKYRTSDRHEFIQLHRMLIEAVERKDVSLAKKRLLEHFKDVIAWGDVHRDKKI